MDSEFTSMYVHYFDTENMQVKINRLEAMQGAGTSLSHNPDKETKWQEIESKIIDVQTKYETDLFAFSNNLTRLEGDSATRQFTIEDHDVRLTQLELGQTDLMCNGTMDLQDHDIRITQLEADNTGYGDAIQHLGAETAQLGTVRAECQENMQIINNTVEQLSRDIYANEDRIAMQQTKVEQLELERTLDQIVMQNLNESITQLELDGIIDFQNIRANISNLERVGSLDRAFTKMLNSSTTQLQVDIRMQTQAARDQNLTIIHLQEDMEKDRALIRNMSDRLSVLEAERIQAVRDQNLTIIHLQEDMEKDRALIRNMSDRLSVVEAERKSDIVTIKENSERLTQLGLDINATNDLHYSLTKRLSYLESKIPVINEILLSCI